MGWHFVIRDAGEASHARAHILGVGPRRTARIRSFSRHRTGWIARRAASYSGSHKAYPGVQALDDISMEVRKGEIHALLGQNGAGKSTLIKLLSGADQPDSGWICLDGHNMVFPTPEEAQRTGIFTIYQELSLFLTCQWPKTFSSPTCQKVVRNCQLAKLRAQAARTMEWIGFSIDVNRPVRTLSVAQKQGVELAKALHHDARVVLLDEPSRPSHSLTFNGVRGLRVLRSRGLALVYISHRLEEVEQLCDIATVLRDGRRSTPTSLRKPRRQLSYAQ